jgi:hypothetical protein
MNLVELYYKKPFKYADLKVGMTVIIEDYIGEENKTVAFFMPNDKVKVDEIFTTNDICSDCIHDGLCILLVNNTFGADYACEYKMCTLNEKEII